MSNEKSLWYLIPLITWYSIKLNGVMIMLLFVFVLWNYIYVVYNVQIRGQLDVVEIKSSNQLLYILV
jgi:hypothetical protein